VTEELALTGFEYAPAPESRSIVRLDDAYGLFVGGEWRAAEETYTTIAPADEEPLATVGQAGGADVDAAVAAAR
jgi:aldehyde dehydrogenase (NAD+)